MDQTSPGLHLPQETKLKVVSYLALVATHDGVIDAFILVGHMVCNIITVHVSVNTPG
jgi:hypothetical protein